MKTTILFFAFFGLINISLFAQTFETNYVRGKSSQFCGEETHRFEFSGRVFERVDTYDGSKAYGPSQKVESNYNDNGYYFEIRTPKFILEEQGINEYRRYYHYTHKIVFDKKGGNVLYVYEVDNDSNGNGKFYLTNAGYQIFCN